MPNPLISLARRLRRGQTSAGRDTDDGALGPLFILLSVIFMNLVGFGIVLPLLPFYAQSFDVQPWQIALLFSAYSFGGFFGEPFWGRLSDRIGRKPILISTVIGNCLCYGALAFAPDFYTALAVRIIGGMMSGNASVIQGYIADITPPHLRSGRLAYLGAAFNLGFIVGPAIGGLLAQPDLGPAGFRIPLMTTSVLCFLSALGVVFLVKESRPSRKGTSPAPQPSRRAMMRFVASDAVVSRLLLVTLVAGFGFTAVESVFGLWGQARFDWGPREIGLMFGIVGVASAICQMSLTGPLSQRFGEARMLAAGMALSAAGSLMQLTSTGFLMSTILLCITAIGNSVAFPNVGALISQSTHADQQGQVLGINNAAGAISRVVGPFCAGIVFAQIHIGAPFVMAAIAIAPAIFLSLAAGRAARRRGVSVQSSFRAPAE